MNILGERIYFKIKSSKETLFAAGFGIVGILIIFGNELLNFKDISSGSKLVSKKLINKIKINTNGPFFGAELAIKSKYENFKIKEVGINTNLRKFGEGLADYATIAGIVGAIGVMAVGELVKRSSKKAST